MAHSHSRIAELLADGSASSRSDIARLLRVAPSTVSVWVGQLIDAEVVIEDGLIASGGGHPRRKLRLNRLPGHLLVARLGGSHTRPGVADRTGQLLHSTTSPLTVIDGPEQALGSLATLLRGQPAEGKLAEVGLALLGPVQPGGAVRLPPRMSGWAGFPMQEAFTESFGVPAVVENNANAMTLRGHRTQFGSGGDSITVKTGTVINSGIVIAGQLYRGVISAVGDVTCTVIHAVGNRPCTCGKTDYLKTVASGADIIARLVEQGVKVTNTADALALAHNDSPETTTMIRTAGSLFGEVLSSMISFFSPQALFLAGGLASLQHFVTVIRTHIYDGCHPLITESLRIEATSLGANAALAGTTLLTAAAIRDVTL